jgi:hypothetical protein
MILAALRRQGGNRGYRTGMETEISHHHRPAVIVGAVYPQWVESRASFGAICDQF